LSGFFATSAGVAGGTDADIAAFNFAFFLTADVSLNFLS
jgi:hypothetical protein